MKSNITTKLSHSYLNLENKLPLEKFIPSAFLIFLLIVFILSIFTFRNIERYKSDMDLISHTNEIIKKLDAVYTHNMQLTLINRGYSIIKDKIYYPRFDSVRQVLNTDISELNILVKNDPEYVSLVKSLDSLSSVNMQINELQDLSVTEQKEITEIGRINFSDIDRIIQFITNDMNSILSNRKESAESANDTIQLFIITTGLFSFLVVGISLYVSDRLIKNKSKAEDLLYKSYEELEDRVEERTLELRDSNEKLNEEIAIRERTESTLRESEQRFKMMADSAPVLIWLSDTEMLRTYFNQVWVAFTGRKHAQEIGNGWVEGVHKDDLKKCLDTYFNSFTNREVFEMEYRLRSGNGDYRWILEKGIPRYEGDDFAGYIGSCIDINERKQNENYLQIQYEVSKTLSESKTIEEASRILLKNVCMGINWNFGILWMADEKNEVLNAESFWCEDDNEVKLYSELQNPFKNFNKGVGFPGIVFQNGKSKWSGDIGNDKSFLRKDAAIKMGWNSAMSIPVSNGIEVIAVIECFDKNSLEEKQELFDVLESAARQIGNFIERKRAEEKLRLSNLELEEKVRNRTSELASALTKLTLESEEKDRIQNRIKLFAHAIRSIKDCVYITDLGNNTLFVNPAFEITYGYNQKDILGKEIPIMSAYELSPSLRNDIVNKTLRDGWRGELMTAKKNGEEFCTYLSTSAIRNEEGEADAIVGICQDITDLKNTEEIIKKRNNLLNVLNDVIRFTNRTFDFRNAIFYSINKVCEYTHWEIGHCLLVKDNILCSSRIWNEDIADEYLTFKETAEKITFDTSEGYPGRTYFEGLASWMSIKDLTDRKVFKRQEVAEKLELRTGIWVPIVMENEVIGVLEFFKKGEEIIDHEILDCIINIGIELGSLCEKLDTISKIKQNEKILNDAQHIAKLGSWEWDVVNDIIIWSDEMYNIYELKKEEFDPTFEAFLARIHNDDAKMTEHIIRNAFENKLPFNFYHRIVTPSGKIKSLKAQGQVYLDENGKVIRMFGTGHDVTEIREAEEELKSTNEKLIQAQKELIYTEKFAALGRFSSGIAHEIRNPLANINSLAQLIEKTDMNEKNKRRLNYIITNVEIANKIIKNLLSYASPEDLDFRNVNLVDMFNGILESVEARCNSNKIKVIRNFPEDLPVLYFDKLKLESAFMNFISNSIDAMIDGGILTVNISEDRAYNEIIIDIIDTGIGIPPENMDKILEPFFTTKDNGVGLGMGLAHQTIRLHKGTFSIQSNYGEGTQIEIKLPVNKKE
ncbi:MAG: PAS domain S-box protein [Ignavibacteria bacterium]|nr:PAS domain S-box protein [Ignavibacteria bacterium]